MASGVIVLILMVLLTVILLHAVESNYLVVFSQVVNMTYVLVGSMLGITVAAILANSMICYYKRRVKLANQEHGVGGQVFVFATQKSVTDSYMNNANFTHHGSLTPRSPICPSCQCSNVQNVPQQKRISPAISHKDITCSTETSDPLDREIIVHAPDVVVEPIPTVISVEVHDNNEIVEVTTGISGQLESYC